MSYLRKENKLDSIREMLLKAVGKNPDLFSYYFSIQEAKELLGVSSWNTSLKSDDLKPLKRVTDV